MQVYGRLAEALDENEIDEILFDAERQTFSIDTETGELTTGLEDVGGDRAVKMSVLAKGTRGTDLWAVYETNHYGIIWAKSTNALLIQVDKTAPEMPFVLSGSDALRTGICVQE